jgi:hypothetical protein
MTIGVVYWPGGLESDWGDSLTGLQPCDPAAQANLVRVRNMQATRPLLLAL